MVERNDEVLRLTVDQAVSQLSSAYIAMINTHTVLKRFPSVMLWGPPGVGKSQGVRQIASEIEAKTGKRAQITDVRLLLFNPVDLRGIPTANADKTLAVWLKPKIFQMDAGEDVINLLFLDEISAAPQSVQAAAYQITLDRTVGEHRLPDNCIVLAAGNRVTDRSVAYTMPKALANRLCHIEITSDYQSWRRWAADAGINGMVLGFLDQNPSLLMDFDPDAQELAFPTPRSWEMVSHILNHVSKDVGAVFPLVSGCIGPAAAYELRIWSESYCKIPDVADIFAGTTVEVPTRPEILFGVCAAISEHARTHHTKQELDHLILYMLRIPAEFRNRILFDLLQIKSIRKELQRNRIFDDWFQRAGGDWEDYGL